MTCILCIHPFFLDLSFRQIPAGIYLLKVNNLTNHPKFYGNCAFPRNSCDSLCHGNLLRFLLAATNKQRFFSTQPQCCLTFSWFELQILLRCWLIHLKIIIMRHFIFIILVSSSRSLSIYVMSLWFMFHFYSLALWLIA